MLIITMHLGGQGILPTGHVRLSLKLNRDTPPHMEGYIFQYQTPVMAI